jgi:hypothetical protein
MRDTRLSIDKKQEVFKDEKIIVNNAYPLQRHGRNGAPCSDG